MGTLERILVNYLCLYLTWIWKLDYATGVCLPCTIRHIYIFPTQEHFCQYWIMWCKICKPQLWCTKYWLVFLFFFGKDKMKNEPYIKYQRTDLAWHRQYTAVKPAKNGYLWGVRQCKPVWVTSLYVRSHCSYPISCFFHRLTTSVCRLRWTTAGVVFLRCSPCCPCWVVLVHKRGVWNSLKKKTELKTCCQRKKGHDFVRR